MRRRDFVLAGLAWLAAGCGESIRHGPAPLAGPDSVVGDAPLAASAWIAVANAEDVRLVSIDDPAAPKSKVLATAEHGFVGAFGPAGDRFAYATPVDATNTVVAAVTAPAGTSLGDSWSFAGRADELVWAGDAWLLANSVTPYAEGALLHFGSAEADATIPTAHWRRSDNGQVLAARLDDDRLMVVDPLDGPEWSPPVSGDWDAFLAGNGLGLAIVGSAPWPTPGLSVSTTLVPTTADRFGSTPDASVSWPTPDEPLLVELRLGALLELAVVSPAAPSPVPFNPGNSEDGPCWVALPDRTALLAERPTDQIEATVDRTPWNLDTAELEPTAPEPLVFERSGLTGVPSDPELMVRNDDASELFVMTWDALTSSSTVTALTLPLEPDSAFNTLLVTNGQTQLLAPAPLGTGVVIGTNLGNQELETACHAATSGCDAGPYFISDGENPAVPLPDGFYDPVWTPDGSGVIGRQGDYVVYVAASEPGVAYRLARGTRFYVPRSF